MKNSVQSGKTLSLLAPYLVASGAGMLVGSIFAVAVCDAANGAAVEGMTEGVFELTKTSAQAWTVGQKVYWDNSNKRCDTDGTVGALIGVATEIAANPTAVGKVRLNGGAPASAEGPQGAIGALTDSTGGSGTHDDTLADGLTVVAITDNGGGTNATDTIAVLVDAGGTAAGAPTTASVADAIKCLSAHINTLVTDITVQNQNDSDLAQKILEIRTALIAAGIIAA